MQPIIGMTSNIMNLEFLPDLYHNYVSLNQSYTNVVGKLGGTPIIIPTTEINMNEGIQQSKIIENYVNLIDGLILTGGDDISPHYYGEVIKTTASTASKEKDEIDLLLLKEAYKQGKPILGICRGMQMMNVAFGGSLCQDVSHCDVSVKRHLAKGIPYSGAHQVIIKSESFLGDIFSEVEEINSLHHQAINKLAPKFEAIAWSEDGLIEGIESKEEPLLVGVQWHPELLSGMENIFSKFIDLTIKVREEQETLSA